jgi:hypothetical protein
MYLCILYTFNSYQRILLTKELQESKELQNHISNEQFSKIYACGELYENCVNVLFT